MMIQMIVDGVLCNGLFNKHYGGFDLHTVRIVDSAEFTDAMVANGLTITEDDNLNLVTWTAHNSIIGRLDDCAQMEFEWSHEPLDTSDE